MNVYGKAGWEEYLLPANLKSSSLLPPFPFPNDPVVPIAAPPMNSPNMTLGSLLAIQAGSEILSLLEEKTTECGHYIDRKDFHNTVIACCPCQSHTNASRKLLQVRCSVCFKDSFLILHAKKTFLDMPASKMISILPLH